MHTVSQNSYDALYWAEDVALYPVSAHEIRVRKGGAERAAAEGLGNGIRVRSVV